MASIKKNKRINSSRTEANEKNQAAMEYLLSYGWTTLIIAVVILILAVFGILSIASTPRAEPGACSVYRPYGPGNPSMVSLIGTCYNELPRYVMESKGAGDFVFVNGSDNYTSYLNIVGKNITITAWVNVNGAPYHDVVDKEDQYGMKLDYNNQPHACAPSYYTGLCLEWDTYNEWNGVSYPIPNGNFGQWEFIAVEMTGNYKYWYANGQLIGSQYVSTGINYVPSNFVIGAITPGYPGYGSAEWFNGSIANVQLYNASLSTDQIKLLYDEGIGGVPVQLRSLVGWWPLNGNANDYSGNGNNGHLYNNTFTGSLRISNYVVP
jgi:hypothetical protein